jgi:hypothetical protein
LALAAVVFEQQGFYFGVVHAGDDAPQISFDAGFRAGEQLPGLNFEGFGEDLQRGLGVGDLAVLQLRDGG